MAIMTVSTALCSTVTSPLDNKAVAFEPGGAISTVPMTAWTKNICSTWLVDSAAPARLGQEKCGAGHLLSPQNTQT